MSGTQKNASSSSSYAAPGRLEIVGIGPGHPDLLTAQASAVLAAATDLVGYQPYLDRIGPECSAARHGSDNREELARARHALGLAAAGARVAVVSGGDAGVFGMAAAVFEAIEQGAPGWRDLDVAVVPGLSALLAASARLGAPLGGDFCALSLSDNLKPWELVASRLQAAAAAGFVLALYNPLSRARPWQLDAAFDLLRAILPPATPVALARAVSRPDEHLLVTSLAEARGEAADMRTLVIVGSPLTRTIARAGRAPWLYTPRSVAR